MDSLVRFLDPLLPVALLATTVAYFLDFRGAPRRQPMWVSASLAVTFALLVIRFVAFLVAEGRPPLATPDEGFGTIALAIVSVYALLELIHRDRALGFPLLGAATLAEFYAVLRHTEPAQVSDLLRQPWFGFHATSAILGYTAFAVSAVYGALFIALYMSLKRAQFGIAFERMPSLDSLSRSSIRSATFGFAFLTASICAGAFGWGRLLEGPVWMDPKVVSTLLAWVVYGLGVSLWHFAGWRGIRAIGLTLIAFALMVLSTWIVPWALGSAHGVRGIA